MQTIAVLVAVIVVTLFVINFLSAQKKMTDPSTLKQKAAEGALIIDVRTPEEYTTGHMAKSKNYPVQSLQNRLDELPRDSAIIVYCLSGHRSTVAARILNNNGFNSVYNAGSYSRISEILGESK